MGNMYAKDFTFRDLMCSNILCICVQADIVICSCEVTCLVSRMSFIPPLPQITHAVQVQQSTPFWEDRQLGLITCELASECLAQPPRCTDTCISEMHLQKLFGSIEPGETPRNASKRIVGLFEAARGSKCKDWKRNLHHDSSGNKIPPGAIPPVPSDECADMLLAWKLHFEQRPQLMFVMESIAARVSADEGPFFQEGLRSRPVQASTL